jgi:F-box protein 9
MMKSKNFLNTWKAARQDAVERSQPQASSSSQSAVPCTKSTTISNTMDDDDHLHLNDSTKTTSTTPTETTEEVWYDHEWELTWPIWHMLPREERRALAQKHGYKTIGEFEEYMSLQRAFGETEKLMSNKPYENTLLYDHTSSSSTTERALDRKPEPASSKQTKNNSNNKNDTDSDDFNSVHNEDEFSSLLLRDECAQNAAADKLPTLELLQRGGMILMLPEDMLHKVFAWLPVDTYATLALVSPHWKSFTRTEPVYKRLCERLYLNQSKRRALHVARFANSYRTMLELRPRVRAMGGIYVMKCSRVRKIQRDMWTEVRTKHSHNVLHCRSCCQCSHYCLE